LEGPSPSPSKEMSFMDDPLLKTRSSKIFARKKLNNLPFGLILATLNYQINKQDGISTQEEANHEK